jgi:ribosomal protein S27E
MRITALRELSRSAAKRSTTADLHVEVLPAPTGDPVRPRLARCECRSCGAHSNAIAHREVHATCPNCGSSRLVPLEGVTVILAAQRPPAAGSTPAAA